MLAHMVYFSLLEPTAENRQKMVDACQAHLARISHSAIENGLLLVG